MFQITYKERFKAVVASSLALLLAAGYSSYSGSVAFALDHQGTHSDIQAVDNALDNLESLNSGLLLNPVQEDSPVGDIRLADSQVVVPEKLTDGITYTSVNGDSLVITPQLSAADESHAVSKDGVATYLDGSSAQSVVVGDAGVQILTTILDEGASTRYQYDLDVAPGDSVTLTEDGGAIVQNADGETTFAIATPWALDANGQEVSTWYELDGDTLVQVIAHDTEDIAYPVVADPIVIGPIIYRCLVGLGLKGPEIVRIMQLGTPQSIYLAFGRAAFACIFMR